MSTSTSRRLFLALCATAFATSAAAQAWPSKPIRLLVAYGAGSPPDVFARLYSEFLAKELGTVIVVENRPGASGNLASHEVARAAGDGYTFLYNVSSAFTINPFVYTKMSFNADKDLVPVATTMSQGFVLVANSNVKANSLPELMTQARAKDAKQTYASWGVGSYSHLLMERVLDDAKGQMLHVPYRTAPVNAVLGGEVDVLIEPMASAYQFITTGKIKALAYTGESRHPAFPAVPTIAEVLPGITLRSWHGIWAPASTPRDIVTRFNAAMVKASKDPTIVQRITSLQCDPLGATPEEMSRMVAKEAAIYSALVKAKSIKLD